MTEQTEKGFVFLGADNKPYLCRMYYGRPWFMYWHEYDKAWVTLREVNQSDIWMARETVLLQEHQDYYHDLHQKFIDSK